MTARSPDHAAGSDDVVDEARQHLDPVVEHLTDKFATTPAEHVAEVVETVFTELAADATIPDHLAALTQHQASEQLKIEDPA